MPRYTRRMKQHHQQRREAELHSSSESELDSQSLFLRASSSSNALSRGERRPRRTSSSEPLQSNASESDSPYLFTPAGDTLPPIATSRSTTALFMKKKQMHQHQQNQLNISSIYPWTGHINGSASSSSSSATQLPAVPPPPPPSIPPPTPDHPPPPYSEACPDAGTTQDLGGPSLNGGRQSRTPSSTFLHSQNASRNQSSAQLYGSPPLPPPSSSRNRSPLRGHLSTVTESLHRIHAELEGSTGRYPGNVPSASPSAIHSRAPSASTSPTHSRTHSQVFTNAPSLIRRRDAFGGAHWDQCNASSPSDDSDAPTREESAIYTSPSRKRKGKERATFDDGDEVGMSSSIQLHDTDVHERRHAANSGGHGHYHDEHSGSGDAGDDPFIQSNGSPHTMPKSCLKPTPTPSSSNLAGSSTTPSSTAQPAKAKPNIGVRFVRFTLGLGGNSKKGKEREREPKLICTTPGEACAGETETETDEPSLRRLPTARRPPSASTERSRLFGFGAWRRGGPSLPQPPPPPPTFPPGHRPRPTGPSPLSLSSTGPFPPNLQPPPPSPHSNPSSPSTRFLFQAFRLLSIVPALCGIIFCMWMIVSLGPLGSPSEQERAREYVRNYWRCTPISPGAFSSLGIPVFGHGVAGGGRFLECDEGRGVLRGPPVPGRVDWVVAAAWALLTAHHCLGLSTGLLARWKVYYTPSSTLVRLLALQGICWPATQLTLTVVGGGRRPVAAWAVIGTCTAVSRSVQIWVTSNIVREDDEEDEKENESPSTENNANAAQDGNGDGKSRGKRSGPVMRFLHAFAAVIGGGSPGDESGDDEGEPGDALSPGAGTTTEEYDDTSTFEFSEPDSPITPRALNGMQRRRRRRRRRRERKWDWKEVGLKCMLPTGMAYFLMAWAEVARREWGSWYYAETYIYGMVGPTQ